MLYLAQVITYTGILWLLYMLLLRNKPMHTFNRMYLLTASILPIILPLLKLPETIPQQVGYPAKAFNLPEIVIGNSVDVPVKAGDTIVWGMIIYTTIAVLALLIVLYKWIRVRKLVKGSNAVQLDGYTLLQNTGYGPGSWGNYIFLPDAEVNDIIIKHEVAHVRLRHSADIMLLSVLQCLLWPNIFLYAIKKELRQVHEFQADNAVGADTDAYSRLLLANLFNTCTVPFAHSFIIHPIKRRIMMLHKRRNKPFSTIIGIVAIAAAGIAVFNIIMLQSCKPKTWEVAQVIETDQPASYNGDLNSFLAKTIVYPKEAIEKRIEGRVVVKFVVDEEGKIVQPRILKSPDTLLSIAALEVISKMPAWMPALKNGKPVATEFYLPISFALGGESYEFRYTSPDTVAKS